MAEYQSIFTGLEVDNALNKLRSWIDADSTTKPTDGSNTDISSVTVDGNTYAVLWKVAPAANKTVYGIGLHNNTGQIYQIKCANGVYTALPLDMNSDTRDTAGSANSPAKLFLIGAQRQASGVDSETTYSNSAVFTKTGNLYATNYYVGGESNGKILATQEWVSGQGYTGNVGTVTAITMNGGVAGSSGNVNLGDIVTGGTVQYAHPSFTGETKTTKSISGSESVASTTHKHDVDVKFKTATTAAGTASATAATEVAYLESIDVQTKKMTASFSGTSATTLGINETGISVTDKDHQHSVTAAGSITLADSILQGSGPLYIESVTYTPPTTTPVTVALGTHTHSYTPSGSVSLGSSDSSANNGVEYIQKVTLPTIKTTTPVAPATHNHTFAKAVGVTLETGSTGDVTIATDISGSAASGSPTYGYLKLNPGTTPKSSATPNHTETATKADSGSGTAVASTVHRHSFTGYELTGSNSSHTPKYMKFSAGTTPPKSASPTNTSTPSDANSGTAVQAYTSISAAGGVSSSRTTSGSGTTARRKLTISHTDPTFGATPAAPNAHTHNYDKTTGVSLTAGTAPSMNFNTGNSSDTPYVASATNSSLALTAKADPEYTSSPAAAANNGSASTTVAAHTHTHPYDKTTSVSLTAGTAPSISTSGTTSDGAIQYLASYTTSGGSWEATTKKIKATISYDTSATTDNFSGTAVNAVTALNAGSKTTQYFHPSFSGTQDSVGQTGVGSQTSVVESITDGSINTDKKYMTGTFTGSSVSTTKTANANVVEAAPKSHTHNVSATGNITLSETADNNGITFVSSTTQSQKYFASSVSVSNPSDTVTVASSDHTHTVDTAGSVSLNLNSTVSDDAIITGLTKATPQS